MTIENVYLPPNVMQGAVSRLVDRTIVQQSDTGFQWRVRRESFPRRSWQIGWNRTEVPQVEAMFQAFGRHTGFLIFAPRTADNTASAQSIGTGDGTATDFQLKITVTSGSQTASKNVLHPKTGTVSITVGGVPKVEGTDYAVNYSTGIVSFGAAPASSAAVVAGFSYYTAVYFDSDQVETTIDRGGSDPRHEIRTATIVEALNE